MKSFLIFLLVLVSITAMAQLPEQYIGVAGNRVVARGQLKGDSGLILSQHDTSGTANVLGSILFVNGLPYFYNGTRWRSISGGDSLYRPKVARTIKDGFVVTDYITDSLRLLRQLVDTTVGKVYARSWLLQKTPLTSVWVGIAYSPEQRRYVVVSHAGTGTNSVMTSTDCINWTVRTAPNSNQWRGVAWSPELGIWAAVGSSGTGNRAMYSYDGITWVAAVSTNDYVWRSVAWVSEIGLFVAVANTASVTNKVMTSPDGINWTARTCPDRAWSDIAYSPQLKLLVVTGTGTTAENKVMTSPDGITWTLRSHPGNAASWEGVCWSGDLGLFAAVAFTNITGTRVMTSPDGITWTLRNTPADRKYLSVAWSPQLGQFAAVADLSDGTADSTTLITSTDGINWVLGKVSPRNWRRIRWFKELGSFVSVAYYDGIVPAPTDSLIMLSRPVDDRQEYVNMYGRDTTQSILGNVNFKASIHEEKSSRFDDSITQATTTPVNLFAGKSYFGNRAIEGTRYNFFLNAPLSTYEEESLSADPTVATAFGVGRYLYMNNGANLTKYDGMYTNMVPRIRGAVTLANPSSIVAAHQFNYVFTKAVDFTAPAVVTMGTIPQRANVNMHVATGFTNTGQVLSSGWIAGADFSFILNSAAHSATDYADVIMGQATQSGSGILVNRHGLYILPLKQSWNNNAYSINQTGLADTNYFAGIIRAPNISTGNVADSPLVVNNGVVKRIAPGNQPALLQYRIGVGSSTNQLSSSAFGRIVDTTAMLQIANVRGFYAVQAGDTAYRFSPFKRSIFFGDSKTVGSAITPYYFRWPTRIANMLNDNEQNLGIGQTRLVLVTPGDSSMQERIFLIPTYDANTMDYLFFAYGTNDVVTLSIDTATFRAVYYRVIDSAIARGWPKAKICINSTDYFIHSNGTINARIPQFCNVIKSVASNYPINFVDTRTAQINAGPLSTLKLPDSVHLNEYGNAVVANAIADTLNIKTGDVRATAHLATRHLLIKGFGNPIGNLLATFLDSSETIVSEFRANSHTATGSNLESQGIGINANKFETSGNSNSAFGPGVLAADTSGSNNSGFGSYALNANLSGSNNAAFGKNSLFANTTGSQNVAIGRDALKANTTGQDNTVVGYTAAITSTTTSSITAVGSFSLNANTAASNTAVGFSALRFNSTGTGNTGIGVNSLLINTTGSSMTAVGNRALRGTSGSFNSAVGANAGDSVTSGTDNVLFGYRAGYNLKLGSFNVLLGSMAGFGIVNGSRNIIIAPGTLLATDVSNTVWLGTTNTDFRIYSVADGKTGLGKFVPTQRLDVGGQVHIDTITNGAFDDSIVTTNAGLIKKLYRPTPTGSATLDFPNTNSGNSSDLTLTVSGAVDSDPISLGIPNGSTIANTWYTSWVSSANTVTVRFTNGSLVAVDPASGTFKIMVHKF